MVRRSSIDSIFLDFFRSQHFNSLDVIELIFGCTRPMASTCAPQPPQVNSIKSRPTQRKSLPIRLSSSIYLTMRHRNNEQQTHEEQKIQYIFQLSVVVSQVFPFLLLDACFQPDPFVDSMPRSNSIAIPISFFTTFMIESRKFLISESW